MRYKNRCSLLIYVKKRRNDRMDYIYLTNLTNKTQPITAFDGDSLNLPANAVGVKVDAKFDFSIDERIIRKSATPVNQQLPIQVVPKRQGV